MKKIFFAILLLAASSTLSYAESFKIIPQKSKIEFKAMQNNSAILGSFKKFEGKIDFDPQKLANSKVEIEIETSSYDCSLSDCLNSLKTAQWLDVTQFAKAIFKADKFVKTGEKKYKANGNLTIKGKTSPSELEFVLDEYNKSSASAHGQAVIKRSNFDVGAKDPANAHGVKDEVAITFVVNAVK